MRKEVRSETRRENKKREVKGLRQVEMSSSESESSSHMAKPVTPIRAKALPRKGGEEWRKKSDKPEPSTAARSSSASASKPAEGSAKERARQTVKAPATKRETSRQAKELFKDADTAKEVYTKFTQEFTNIQWFQRPEGQLCCKKN